MRENFEVFNYSDKDQRDSNFEQLRLTGNPAERKVVKFSDVEPLLNPMGQQLVDENNRKRFRSVWSLAYPRELSGRKPRLKHFGYRVAV